MALPRPVLLLLTLVLSYLTHYVQAQAQYTDPGCGGSGTTTTVTWTIEQRVVTETSIATVTYTDPSSTDNVPVSTTAAVNMKYLAVNNEWPAKPIIVTKCSFIKLTVVNGLDTAEHKEDVSLHFHGLYMADGNVIYDGPEGLTQR